MVYTGSPFALILGHSFDCQRFRAKRASQPPLQSFHSAPVAFLRCLRYSTLHDPHVLLDAAPVDGGPLRPGFRFLPHPIPAPPTASLAGRLPPSDSLKGWQRVGLTTFPVIPTRRVTPRLAV